MSTTETLPESTLFVRGKGAGKRKRELAVEKSAVATARAAFPHRIFTAQEVYVEMRAQLQRPENASIEGIEHISAESISIRLAKYAWQHPRELCQLPGSRFLWKQEEEA